MQELEEATALEQTVQIATTILQTSAAIGACAVDPSRVGSIMLSAAKDLQDAAATARICEKICRDIMLTAIHRVPVVCKFLRLGQMFLDDGDAADLDAKMRHCCKDAFATLQEAVTEMYKFMQYNKVSRMMMAAGLGRTLDELRNQLRHRFEDVGFFVQLASLLSNRQTSEQVTLTTELVHELERKAHELKRMCSPNKARVQAVARAALARRAARGQKIKVSKEETLAVAVSLCGGFFATASVDGTVAVWDAATGARIHELRERIEDIRTVAWSPDGSRLITAAFLCDTNVSTLALLSALNLGTMATYAVLWRADTGERIGQLQGHLPGITAIAWSPDGHRVATGSVHATVSVWDAATGDCARELQGEDDQVDSIEAVAWSPDGTTVASHSHGQDAAVILWDVGDVARALRVVLQGPEGVTVLSIAWSPDGSKLATGLSNGFAAVWDTSRGVCMHELHGCRALIRSVAWHPDGSRVATGSDDGTVAVWDAGDGSCRSVLQLHGRHASARDSNAVLSVAWSPDGSRVATRARDNAAAVWDAASGGCLCELRDHSDAVISAEWLLDGCSVCTASRDGTLRIYSVAASLTLGTAV